MENTRKSAFTLVELLVVMVIFATIIAAGLTALDTLSKHSQVNTASVDFLTLARTYQSRARNSIYTSEEITSIRGGVDYECSFSNPNFPPDAVGLYFSNESYQYIKCLRSDSVNYEYCCTASEILDSLEIRDKETVQIVPQDGCTGVLFEYATGELVSFDSSALSSINTSETDCSVLVSLADVGYSKNILFSAASNEISSVE